MLENSFCWVLLKLFEIHFYLCCNNIFMSLKCKQSFTAKQKYLKPFAIELHYFHLRDDLSYRIIIKYSIVCFKKGSTSLGILEISNIRYLIVYYKFVGLPIYLHKPTYLFTLTFISVCALFFLMHLMDCRTKVKVKEEIWSK